MCFGFSSCEDDNITNSKNGNNLQKAKVYFYTNLHAVANCPKIVVKLFVEEEYVGDLTGGVPFEVDIETLKKYNTDTNYTDFLVYETDVPKTIKYRTEGKCNNTNFSNFYGEVTIYKDSSYIVFLDVFNTTGE
jgi:hypothetical protein